MIHALSASALLGSALEASSAYQHNQTDLEVLARLGANPSARDFDSSKNEIAIESLQVRLAAGVARGTHAFVLMADSGGQFFAYADAAGAAGRNE
ncbi:MAG TPA: hypothetical protein VIY30_07820 [Burkholderiaceae bacterium]